MRFPNGLILLVLSFLILVCRNEKTGKRNIFPVPDSTAFYLKKVEEIPLPLGFKRIELSPRSFGAWLRQLRLKDDKHVFLYDGSLRKDQYTQYAVLNIDIGNKNLLQCADVVMKLWSNYLYDQGSYEKIKFTDLNRHIYQYYYDRDKRSLNKFLVTVFTFCGSASLEKQLRKVGTMKDIQPGDVLIQGGFPGHAELVLDVAINQDGEKIFLLAQGFMPAQDIHILKNLHEPEKSPWYRVDDKDEVVTPQWTFSGSHLRRF